VKGVLLALALAAGAPPLGAPEGEPQASPLPEAQPIGFHALAARASVRLGEPFAYSVEIRHPPEERYALRKDPALAPFRADRVSCRRDLAEKEVKTTCTMQLSLFALGQVDVPDLVFDVDRPAGKAQLRVPGPRITGVGILDPAAPPASLHLRDIAPPAPLLLLSLRPLFWALAVLSAAALAFPLGRALLRRLGAREGPPPLSPFERFARRLSSLEAERLPERGEGSDHVARLSEAVRDYLGALLRRPALDLTSAELLAALRAAPDPRLDLVDLERFLRDADLVKFAREPAGHTLCRAGLDFAKRLLDRTRPKPEEARR
jgi:hypothetical protein